MKHYFRESLLSLAPCFLVLFDGFLPSAFAHNAPARIEIVVVEGEGATSGLRQRASHDPLVRIEDDDHRPVAGALPALLMNIGPGASISFPISVDGGEKLGQNGGELAPCPLCALSLLMECFA
jgi:hypothetical protein